MTTSLNGPRPTFAPARDLLVQLEPAAGRFLERHLSMAKEWFPHDFVPYSVGRDFEREPWTPDQPRITGVAQVAFEVNLLTEDNLPSYHREIHRMFGAGDGAWINWVNRWTAEEGRHGIVLRDYLVVTRNIDPVSLERSRMNMIQAAYNHDDDGNVLRGLAYVAFQELATRISHKQHRPLLGGPGGRPDHGPHRGGREPAHGLLSRHAVRGDRARSIGGGARGRG